MKATVEELGCEDGGAQGNNSRQMCAQRTQLL